MRSAHLVARAEANLSRQIDPRLRPTTSCSSSAGARPGRWRPAISRRSRPARASRSAPSRGWRSPTAGRCARPRARPELGGRVGGRRRQADTFDVQRGCQGLRVKVTSVARPTLKRASGPTREGDARPARRLGDAGRPAGNGPWRSTRRRRAPGANPRERSSPRRAPRARADRRSGTRSARARMSKLGGARGGGGVGGARTIVGRLRGRRRRRAQAHARR